MLSRNNHIMTHSLPDVQNEENIRKQQWQDTTAQLK